jgi:hypothetical protein
MNNTIIGILGYFFEFSPSQNFGLQWIAWSFVCLALISAIIIYIKAKKSSTPLLRKILMEYPGKLVTISILLLLNILSRLNRIEVLSMRFVTYLLLIWLLYSYFSLYRDLTVTYPHKLQQQKQKFVSLEEKFRIHKNKSKKHRIR